MPSNLTIISIVKFIENFYQNWHHVFLKIYTAISLLNKLTLNSFLKIKLLFWFHLQHVKGLEIPSLTTQKKRQRKLNINDFSYNYWRTAATGHMTNLKSGEADKYREPKLSASWMQKPIESQTGRNTKIVTLTNCWKWRINECESRNC